MAKLFYTLEEVQQKLARSEDDVKQLVTDGLLREFLGDNKKKMYKVDEVDHLAAGGLGGSGAGEIRLAAHDSGATYAVKKSDDSGDRLDLAPADSGADRISLEDTSKSPADSDDTVITKHGLNVLDDSGEAGLAVDPLAQTQMAPDLEDLDKISLDSGSSGSGLLDLSREADDTSLGAELLEEIYPGKDEHAVETQVPQGFELPATASATSEALIPIADFGPHVQVEDPTSSIFGVMLLVPLLMFALLAAAAAAAVGGVWPSFLESVGGVVWFVVGGAGALAVLVVLIGNVVVNRSGAPAAARGKKSRQKQPESEPQKQA